MTYKTSLDNLAKWVTAGTTMLFAAAIILIILFAGNERYAILIFITFALVIYFGIFLYRPVSYSLTDYKLIIHRPISDISIHRKDIVRVEQLGKDKLAWSIRTFGVNGLFGYFGKFANTQMGNMTWYATRRNKAVLVSTTDKKKIIVTPDEPEKFVASFKA